MNGTLSLYIARRFLATTAWIFVAVFMLVVVVDLVELMRANDTGAASFGTLVWMALLHAPSITIMAGPFTLLLASMATFSMLSRSSELVVTRAAGVSAWRVITPALICAATLGVFSFAVYNPIASAFASRFEVLQQRFFDSNSSHLALSDQGLWLRQGGETGQTVIRAKRASRSVDRLWNVSIFQFDRSDRLYQRIDARSAVLGDRNWTLDDVRRWDLSTAGASDQNVALAETRAAPLDRMRIPTDLTVEHIQESFAPPETISFWKLPRFIALLEESGFSSSRHRMHWYRLLSAPVVFVAMVLVGAAFSMRHFRVGGFGFAALGCIISGFAYFFLSDIANALGASGAVPVALAAWAPPLSAALFALGLLLHLEDG